MQKIKINKIINILICITLLFFMVVLIIYPDRYIKTSFEGIKLFALTVMPSLLPFFFLTGLLTKIADFNKMVKAFSPISSLLFNASGISVYIFLMSILSGYPVGARITYDLRKNGVISQKDATVMSIFCSTSGPLFVIGAVGTGMFQDKRVGFIIYLSHILSAILSGIIFRFLGEKPQKNGELLPQNNTGNILYESIYDAVISVMIVGGFVSIFYVLSKVLCDFNLLKPLIFVFSKIFSPISKNFDYSSFFCQGLIECTRGINLLSSYKNAFSYSLATSLISFGGISIIMQSVIYLSRSKIKTWLFLIGKITQMLLSFTVSFILFNLIPL